MNKKLAGSSATFVGVKAITPELRKKTLPFAEAQGLISDEDVLRALS